MTKAWGATQKAVVLSSGEAELVAAVKMCTEIIGVSQLAADWGKEVQGKLYLDSSAAIGVAHRKGNGKLRHVRVGNLWIQQKVEDKEVEVKKVNGEENPADLTTKNVGAAKVDQFCKVCNQNRCQGRADKGLKMAQDDET